MATPTWFDKVYYLNSKLAQLVASGDNRYADIVALDVAIEAAGFDAFSHFQAFSLVERTSPNPYFNAGEYLTAKAAQANATAVDGKTNWTADSIALAIKDARIATIWDHFVEFGWKEEVNPSNAFDVITYFDDKLAQLQADEPDAGWTRASMKAAFEAAGLDPVTHFQMFGTIEGLSVTVVPAAEQVGGGSPVPSDPTVGKTFTLTAGADNIVGTTGNDTINASDTTITGLDKVDGGLGTGDTLNISDVAGAAADLTLLSVSNVENLVLTSSNGLKSAAADVSSWTGLTSAKFDLRAVAADQTITVADTTAVEVTAKVITAASALTINGGSTVVATVNNTVANAAKNITVDGGAATTAVTVTQTVSGAGTAAGVVITDKNAAVDTTADTITTVTLSGLKGGVAAINSDALATLNLSSSDQNVTIDNDTADHALTLNLNGVTGGTISDTVAKSITVNATGKASSGTTLTGTVATAINFTGDQAVSTALGVQAANLVISSDNTAGVTITTALNTDVAFTGGAGADAVTVAAHTKAVNMGAGDDTVTATAALASGGSVAGGDDNDTLVADAAAFSLAGFTGFETLGLGANATGAYDATGFSGLTQGAVTGAVTYNNVAAGTGLTITAAPIQTTDVNLASITGGTDVLNLTVKSAAAVDTSAITANGVETINVASTDTDTTQHQNIVNLASDVLNSVVITGNAGVALTAADTTITSVDASALSLTGTVAAGSGFTWTSAAVTDNLVVKGSATGGDNIDVSLAATAGKTVTVTTYAGDNIIEGSDTLVNHITGGTGADTIIGGADVIVGGGGADVITGGAGADSITISGTTATIEFTAGDSGANTSTTIQTAELTSTFDVVYGATAGTTIDLSAVNGAFATSSLVLNGINLAGQDDMIVFVNGTYDAAAGTFTYAANGPDTAVTYDTDTAATTAYESIILVGVDAGAATTAVSGVITLA